MRYQTTTALCLLLTCGTLHAAAIVDEMEEIVVEGQQLSVLERQIFEAEDSLFGLFNQLNTDNLYDVYCVWKAPLGTRLREHSCRPNFFMRTGEEYAEGIATIIRRESGGTLQPDNQQLVLHYPILEQKMKALVQQHPELQDAVTQLNALRAELEQRRKDAPF